MSKVIPNEQSERNKNTFLQIVLQGWTWIKPELNMITRLFAIATGVSASFYLIQFTQMKFTYLTIPASKDSDLIWITLIISCYMLPRVCKKIKRSKNETWIEWLARNFSEGVMWTSMLIPDGIKELKAVRRLIDWLNKSY